MFSVPLDSPSPSQSAAAHIALVVTGVAPTAWIQGSCGAVSIPFGVPSPSQSNTDQVA